jgi:DNA-binding CsgD family transcriptional regulator
VAAEHVVQIYCSDTLLIDTMDAFIGDALRSGNAAVVIATRVHQGQFERRIEAGGFDLDAARDAGQYVALDAATTLDRLDRGGQLDPDLFEALVGSTVKRLSTQWPHVRAFGEMVGLLAGSGKYDAAVSLEYLWDAHQQITPFSLHCAYHIDQLAAGVPPGLADQIFAVHSSALPSEEYLSLSDEQARLRMVALLQLSVRRLDQEAEQQQQAARSRTQVAQLITRREREVAKLLVDGLSNAQIAERLVLSEGTVANHVGHILQKLGLRSRTQIAMWATRHGICGSDDVAIAMWRAK